MSGKVRLCSFAGLLAAGVAGAVSLAVAQGPPPLPDDAPERGARRAMMMLDGHGSRLGVMVQDLDAADKTGGVRIDSVDPGSAAEKAGVKAGDVVVEYDGERVRSARQFSRLVQETPEGRQVAMAVMRDGRKQTLTAVPEARAMTWNMSIDGDSIRRDVERSLEGLHEFRMDMPPMRFRYENDFLPSKRRRLGVSVDPLSDQLAQYFGATGGGALVTTVDPESAAAKAGLKAGDVITSINGTRVHDADEVRRSLVEAKDGEISIEYLRDKKAGTTKAILEAPAGRSQERRPEERRPVRPAAYTPA